MPLRHFIEMNRLPAITGWLWVKEGFALFRMQPLTLSMLFVSYMFLMILIGLIPLLGQLLPLLLLPVFSLAFLRASAQVRAAQAVRPNLLFEGFRSPHLKRLVLLGSLQLLVATAALGASSLIDGGLLWKILSGQIALDPKVVAGSNLGLAMLFSAALYVPASMAFWYAAPLIAWHQMGVGKAVFYSFFAVLRETRAYLVYGVAWAGIAVFLPAFLSLLLAVLFKNPGLIVVVMMPVSLLLTVVLYASFYVTYTDVFGTEPAPPFIDIAV